MPNSDVVNVAREAESLEKSDKLAPYTKVRIYIGDSSYVESDGEQGVGRLLEIDNPFGTKQMANDMLAKLEGKQYQPFEATGAQVDPAAEIGDGVYVNGLYGGLYKSRLTFSALMSSNVGSPYEEEIDSKYKWESESERKFTRQVNELRASLMLTQEEIMAEVVHNTGGVTDGFRWSLTSGGHNWYAMKNGSQELVMGITASGLIVKGIIEAESGHIGGFTITDTKISNYGSGKGIWMSSVPWTEDYEGNPVPPTDPAYNDVLQIGSNFHVKNDGSIVANNGTFNGTIRAGNIQYGGDNGYFNGGGIAGGSVGVSQLSTYAGGGVEGGVSFNKTTDPNTTTRPDGYFGRLNTTRFSTGGYDWGTMTLQYKDHNGINRSVVILAGRT